jgi:methionine-S-sulfoxide reductase
MLSLVLAATLAATPKSATEPAKSAAAATAERGEAIFAAGCFWCTETAFEGQPGVTAVVSGFIGGHVKNPTYEQVGRGGTGYTESVKVTYDPTKTSYAKLLDVYWRNVDPVDNGGQFCDRGDQYRPGIFYFDDAQKAQAESSKAKAESAKKVGGPIVVEITKAGDFYPAEEYHQDFWKKDPDRYYSYRKGCGRDARLEKVWGEPPHPLVH